MRRIQPKYTKSDMKRKLTLYQACYCLLDLTCFHAPPHHTERFNNYCRNNNNYNKFDNSLAQSDRKTVKPAGSQVVLIHSVE